MSEVAKGGAKMKKNTKEVAVKKWTLSISFASSGRTLIFVIASFKRPICRGLARLDHHEFQHNPVPCSLYSKRAWYELNKPPSRQPMPTGKIG